MADEQTQKTVPEQPRQDPPPAPDPGGGEKIIDVPRRIIVPHKEFIIQPEVEPG